MPPPPPLNNVGSGKVVCKQDRKGESCLQTGQEGGKLFAKGMSTLHKPKQLYIYSPLGQTILFHIKKNLNIS
jgi:hypothetical protein